MTAQPPRVLSVIHGPAFGGPHNRNRMLARWCRETGAADWTIVLPEGPAAQRLRAEGAEVLTLALGRLRASADPRVHAATWLGWPGDVRRLVRTIRAQRAQVVLLNGLANAQAAAAARIAGVPLVWQILDTRTPGPLVRLLRRPLVRWPGAVMATGRSVAERHLGPDVGRAAGPLAGRLVPFFPPVDPEVFAPDPAAAPAARAELGLGQGPVVGMLANLTPQKGHPAFLEAAARLRALQPAVRFLWLGQRFAGQAAYADRLAARARALGLADLVVRDPGAQPARLARALDVAWLTSPPASEGIPTAAAEVMALATPLVAFRVGALGELVRDGASGRLVAPGDTAALAVATAGLLDDPGARTALGRAARARVQAACSPAACAEAHLRAIHLALGQPPGTTP